jgi:ATP dependent DNA ligase domain
MTNEKPPIGSLVPRQLIETLRPQVYGNTAPHKIRDPLIEPLWTGIRALAAVDGDGATLVDADGYPVEGMVAIIESLMASAQASGLVLDGFLTKQTAHLGSGILWPDEMPSMGRLVGLRNNRATDTIALKEEALEAKTFATDDEVAFVATDLLWLDDTELLDVPLLERRRLLDAVLLESDIVRVGAYVRPPVDAWVSSWRTQGFDGLTYKAANSRYLPGRPNPDWVITGMPRR